MKLATTSLLAAAAAASAQCTPAWTPGFGPAEQGLNGPVYALAAYDDGTGPALYAGGAFSSAGGVTVNNIARWNGSAWSALGEGVGNSGSFVAALAVYSPDINPPRLVAGGYFTSAGGLWASNVADWNGSYWRPLGLGTTGNFGVNCLAAHGPHLYAGGSFTGAGGVATNFISRWNGDDWIWPGGAANGTSGGVNALASFAGSLYAAGAFPSAGMNTDARFIARWTGSAWANLASGLASTVDALVVFDDGSGAALYAGGNFTSAVSGPPVARIARWNGTAWSALGAGCDGRVRALAVFDDGNGPALYAAGDFFSAGGVTTPGIARWRGGAWSALGTALVGGARALAVFDDDGAAATPAALYAGGSTSWAGGLQSSNIARWACSICYANCDASSVPPVLNVLDFACFLNRFAAGDPYANCDGSSIAPLLNVLDFACFLNRFAAGCP
jgi:hypothetical protein